MAITEDDIVPLLKGGSTRLEHLLLLCNARTSRKGATLPPP
jgi:hypothetical protein